MDDLLCLFGDIGGLEAKTSNSVSQDPDRQEMVELGGNKTGYEKYSNGALGNTGTVSGERFQNFS